ncbi:MAG TPA: hypothetical protein VFS70_15425, partial [Actinomycetota bacterium]|nr:hypothetical protein [Actinomycetota bacterium]
MFIEDFQGTTALDDPAFTDRLGYEGQVYEDRAGVYNLTIHTSGSMASVTHVEGRACACSRRGAEGRSAHHGRADPRGKRLR